MPFKNLIFTWEQDSDEISWTVSILFVGWVSDDWNTTMNASNLIFIK